MRRAHSLSLLTAIGMLVVGWGQYAHAQVLSFEGLQNDEYILGFYGTINGGAGSLGSVGPNYNINFPGNGTGGEGGQALLETAVNSNFMNEPSYQTILYDFDNDLLPMDVVNGDQNSLSFYYGGNANSSFDTVKLYNSLGAQITPTSIVTNYADNAASTGGASYDADGMTVDLASIPNVAMDDPNRIGLNNGNGIDPNNNQGIVTNSGWDQVTINFPGQTAYTVDFQGGANVFALDNIAVPEPASASLLMVSAIGLTMRRRRKAA
jgi:hypothetical protein